MNITYNNESSFTNMLTYTGIPNILAVNQEISGTKYECTITTTHNIVNYAGEADHYIEFTIEGNQYSIQSDSTYDKTNVTFYIDNPQRTAHSICQALNNNAALTTNYKIYMEDPTSNIIYIVARGIGTDYNITISTDLIDGITISETSGTINNSFDSVAVDFYTDEYITTLTKRASDTTRFDLSGLLSTITEYGAITPYSLKVYGIYDNNRVIMLNNNITAYSCAGYQVNQGDNYKLLSSLEIAQNVTRGDQRAGITNNTILYLYGGSNIDISFYSPTYQIIRPTVSYKTSALEEVATERFTYTADAMSLVDMSLPTTLWASDIYYIDVIIGNKTFRYNCINPNTATSHCQRVWFRNSYGGISFFDFTGNREEERDTEITTYQRSHYDYYDGKNVYNKIFDVSNVIQVKLTSHLISKDGKWLFNDLINSKELWTEVNGQIYSIIPKSISVDETDVTDVYTATLTYNYSNVENLM